MIEVVPATDELALSHETRRMILTGCSSRQAHLRLLKQELGDKISAEQNSPRLALLALASGMAPEDYACSHSMLAVQRVAARNGLLHEHGSPMSASFTSRLGMLPQRAGAYMCHTCVDEMLAGPRKVSWYIRSHHLVGVDWCATHGTVLDRVDARRPFDQLPHHWREAGKTKPVDASHDDVPTSAFLARYISLLQHLLSRRRPVSCQALNRLIANRAKTLGLRTSNKGQRPLLSDRLFELADHRWLCRHIPGAIGKRRGEFFGRIDMIATSYSVAASGDAYAMALTAAFDDVSEAIEAVQGADCPEARSTPSFDAPVVKRMSPQFWHGDIWPLYLQHEGSARKIAAALNMDRTYLGSKLAEIGLPSLHQSKESGLWRSFLRFRNGSTLTDACIAEGVAIAALEQLLRTCSARVAHAVKAASVGQAIVRQSDRSSAKTTQAPVDNGTSAARSDTPVDDECDEN